jgi:hypothetical protein
MSGTLVHVGAVVMCAHGAPATVVPGSARVTVSGMPVATMADQFLVAGCTFPAGFALLPCLRVQWLKPATRVLVGGLPPIVNTSAGLCLNQFQMPQGPPVVVTTQPRVIAT